MQILTAGNGQKLQKLMFLFHEINLRMKVFPVCFSQNIAPGIVYQKYQALQDRDVFTNISTTDNESHWEPFLTYINPLSLSWLLFYCQNNK